MYTIVLIAIIIISCVLMLMFYPKCQTSTCPTCPVYNPSTFSQEYLIISNINNMELYYPWNMLQPTGFSSLMLKNNQIYLSDINGNQINASDKNPPGTFNVVFENDNMMMAEGEWMAGMGMYKMSLTCFKANPKYNHPKNNPNYVAVPTIKIVCDNNNKEVLIGANVSAYKNLKFYNYKWKPSIQLDIYFKNGKSILNYVPPAPKKLSDLTIDDLDDDELVKLAK